MFGAGILQPQPPVVAEAAPDQQLPGVLAGAPDHQLGLGEHCAHRLAHREVVGVHVVAGGLHQHLAHPGPAQFEQGLSAADVDHLDVLPVEGFAQLLLGGQLLATGHDQQP
uniref:Secreted protein n=1 Tax=Steinernema glaseri TaxID=37863 RepID=A0A1I7ZAB8_9BILA